MVHRHPFIGFDDFSVQKRLIHENARLAPEQLFELFQKPRALFRRNFRSLLGRKVFAGGASGSGFSTTGVMAKEEDSVNSTRYPVFKGR